MLEPSPQFVLLLGEDCREAAERGENCWELASRLFREMHAIDFSPQEIASGKEFTYEENTDGDVFRITYVGKVH